MKKKIFLILILPALALVGAWLLRGVFATSNPHTWTNGLVGYWSFDGQYTTSTNGTRDVSNNNNWGAFNGGVKPVAGIAGQSLSFDGVNDYVDAGSGANLDITGTAITIEFWIKPNVTSGYILAKASPTVTSPYWQYDLEFNGAKIRWGGDMDGTAQNKDSTGSIPVGQWTHVVVTYNGSNVTYYFNGAYDSAPALTGNLMTHPTWELWLGDLAWDSTNFNGLLDEVRIYNRALSASEVKQHYDQTKRNFTVNHPSGAPPIGWWKLDEATGQTVRDYSVNANNGTVSNGGYGATSTDGKIGKALNFDGVDYISANSSGFNNLYGTLEMWIKAGRYSGATQNIYWIENAAPWHYHAMRISYNNIGFGVYDGTDTIFTQTTAGAEGWSDGENEWHHLVGVWNADTISFYADGVFKQSNSQTLPTDIAGNPLAIGAQFTSASGFEGIIDDVRIYNYARTADQIAADFRAGAYRTTIAASNPNDWSNGLVAYWSFDGQYTTSTNGTRDTSGNNNWATFQNGAKPVPGISGQALSFDGSNDYVDAGNGASLQITGALTIEAWVKFAGWPKVDTDAREHIVAKGREGAGSPYTNLAYSTGVETYGATDERLYFYLYHSAASFSYLGYTYGDGFRKDYGNWHHYVFTFDGTTDANGMKIYIDGSLKAQKASSSATTQSSTLSVQLGFAETYYGNLYGSLDEVRIYNRALSDSEVLQHYQQTRRNLGL